MNVPATVATLALLAAAGCCCRQPQQSSAAAAGQGHPASPLAAEAPAPAESATLKPHAGMDRDGAAPGGGISAAAAPPDADDALASPAAYTCPHHPKVMDAEPGDCPYCGMKLEATTSRQTSPLRERNDLPTPAAPEGTDDAADGHEGHGADAGEPAETDEDADAPAAAEHDHGGNK